MAKTSLMSATLQHFGYIVKFGNFKKCFAKTKTGESVYVNPDAEFLVVHSRYINGNGEKVVRYYYSNSKESRLVAKNAFGYSVIILDHAYTIHRLVADAHLGPRPKGYEINHIDENKQNNCLSNLEYVTHKENMQKYWATRKGNVTRHSFGRYHHATQQYTAPDGTKTKMTFDEYINFIRTTRGKYAADGILRNYYNRTKTA